MPSTTIESNFKRAYTREKEALAMQLSQRSKSPPRPTAELNAKIGLKKSQTELVGVPSVM